MALTYRKLLPLVLSYHRASVLLRVFLKLPQGDTVRFVSVLLGVDMQLWNNVLLSQLLQVPLHQQHGLDE